MPVGSTTKRVILYRRPPMEGLMGGNITISLREINNGVWRLPVPKAAGLRDGSKGTVYVEGL